MAEKISTLILEVDLDCELCYRKIRTVLCKLQDKEKIKAISYDEKNKTVTISGPFDPQKLSKILRCKSGKVIKEIQIKENKEKEKEKEKEKKKEKEKEKPKDEPAEKEKPKETQPVKDKQAGSKPAKEEPKKDDPTQSTAQPGPQIAPWPAGPVCCYRPLYEVYSGGCRCRTCGRAYVLAGPGPMAFHSYQFFCEEEDPSYSCRIM